VCLGSRQVYNGTVLSSVAACVEAAAKAPRRKRAGSSSLYHGVDWHKNMFAWRARLTDPRTDSRRCIGYFEEEEDAARAHDWAAVSEKIPDAELNFPGEAISEPKKKPKKN
jgi:hypothetical protein